MSEARTKVQLRWRDLDLLGHLNQSVYHELREEGRGALLARGNHSFPFVLAHVEIDYRHEVRRDHDHVEVVSRIVRIGRTSVTLAERIEVPDRTPAAAGKVAR